MHTTYDTRGLEMKFKNLNTELARKGITYKKIAEITKLDITTVNAKLNRKRPINLKEVAIIASVFDNEFTVEYLFSEFFEN